MTALCGGGTSAPNTGAAAVVDLASGYAALMLSEAGAPWLLPFIPFAGLGPLVLSTFCGTDPPALPTFTSGEANAFLNLQIGTSDWNSAVSKLGDTILNAAWYQFCHCTSAPMPVIGTAPTPPTGTPVYSPPPAAAGGACYAPAAVVCTYTFPNAASCSFPVPQGAVSLRITYQANLVGGSHHTIWNTSWQFNLNATLKGQNPHLNGPLVGVGARVVDVDIVQGGSDSVLVLLSPQDTFTTDTITVTAEFFCSSAVVGGGSSGQPGLNTGDQAVLQSILDMVTLIQRQAVPFAYVPGTVHSGLTGSGELHVQGLIGAKVVITGAIAGTIGVIAGDPDENFGLGWVTWGSADGWEPRAFLGHADNVLLPGRASAFTVLGYSLAPGVTATITELRREA